MKTLLILIIVASFLVLSAVHQVEAVPPASTQDLYDWHDVILLGKVISKNSTFSPTHFSYEIKVEKYLKNPQPYGIINAAGLNRLNPNLANTVFEVGDRVLFFLNNYTQKYDSNNPFTISIRSIKDQPEWDLCNLFDKEIPREHWVFGPGYVSSKISQGNETNIDNFSTNKEILISYDFLNHTPETKYFEFGASITQWDNPTRPVVFRESQAFSLEPCTVYKTITWSFVPTKAGHYSFETYDPLGTRFEIGFVVHEESNIPLTQNFIGNDLHPPVLTSPLKQFKSGIPLEQIQCKEGLELIFKAKDDSPACVKPETKQKLIERGWGFDNNFLTLIEESDRIITGMVTDVEKYDNGRREVFLGVYEWLKNGTNAGAFLELDDIKNKETSKIDFKRGEKVLLFLKDIDENRGARDIFYTEKILPAKYPISLRDKVFSLVKPEDRGIQTRYQYDENCSKRDLFGDSYMYCTYEEKDARFYVPIDITAELVRNKLLEHVSEKYLQEHFDLKRAYDQAVINGHITPSGQVMEFEYKLDDMTFLYLANISLSYSEVYLYYAPPREIQSLQYAEKMNDLIHSCFEPDTIVVFWDKVAVSHIENGFSPVITGAGPPAIYDRHGNTIQNHEKHFRFWPETGEIECSQGMQELPNKIKMQDKELLIDTTQFLKFK